MCLISTLPFNQHYSSPLLPLLLLRQVLVNGKYKGAGVIKGLEKAKADFRIAQDMDLDVDFITGAGRCAVYFSPEDLGPSLDWKAVTQRVKAAIKYSHPTIYLAAVPTTQKHLEELRNNLTCRYRVPVIFVS